jgi:acyl-CoA hydrolase
MGNIGSEVGRALKWKGINTDRATSAAERALELIDLSLSDPKNRPYLKEIARVREIFADSFYGENQYGQSESSWDQYFLPYALAANRR